MASVADIYQSQLGRAPDEGGLTYWTGQLDAGMSLADIEKAINSSLEGQNYDTQTVSSAYRENFARNPEQEGYQYWLSNMQADPTLGAGWASGAIKAGAQGSDITASQNGPYASANVAALEADPYAGRYATQSIYDLIPDAVNVSKIVGKDAQFVTPVGQTAVVSNLGADGSFSATPGQYTVNPGQAAAQTKLALASGALSNDQYQSMLEQLSRAQTDGEMQAAFNAPTARIGLGTGGTQTSVNGADVNFNPLMADSYAGVDTRTSSSDFVNGSKSKTVADYINSQINPNYSKLKFSGQPQQKLQNFGTFGASGDERMGAGDANYESNLIQSLRSASNPLVSNNTGVTKYGYSEGPSQDVVPSPYELTPSAAFNPKVFQSDVASADDVADWNAYGTYKTNSLNAKTPYLSLAEWLSGGKPDGKPAEQPVYQYDSGGGG